MAQIGGLGARYFAVIARIIENHLLDLGGFKALGPDIFRLHLKPQAQGRGQMIVPGKWGMFSYLGGT